MDDPHMDGLSVDFMENPSDFMDENWGYPHASGKPPCGLLATVNTVWTIPYMGVIERNNAPKSKGEGHLWEVEVKKQPILSKTI